MCFYHLFHYGELFTTFKANAGDDFAGNFLGRDTER